MATILANTGVIFPDGTTQTTAAVTGGGVVTTIYTSPATWTKPATVKSIKVTIVSGGGGGQGGAPGTLRSGGNGAAGMGFYQALDIPGPVAVTVGAGGSGGAVPAVAGTAGGTSSFGPLISATGGAGGTSTPGVASGGAFTPSPTNVGSPGQPGATNSNYFIGSSGLGFGFSGAISAGNGFGGGGSYGSVGPPATAGYSGATGVVIVEEFY
jgi:hypothetical protein